MKKLMMLLAVLTLVMSAAVFAGEGREMARGGWEGNERPDCSKMGERPGMGQRMMGRGGEEGFRFLREVMIFDKIEKEDFIKAGVTEENYIKASVLINTSKTAFEKNHIAIQQKHLEIKKLTLEDNKNWTEIEKLFNEASKMQAENGLKALKVKDELKKYITDEQFKKAAMSEREKHQPRREWKDNGKDR